MQCAVHFFRRHAMMPRKRSILREEASGAIKTLKRLQRTNPSVGIDGMNDYQATYNKRWQYHVTDIGTPDIVPDIDPDIRFVVYDIGDMMTRYPVSTRYRYPILGHMRHVPISGQKKTPISGHITRYRVSG